ncbi:MAG: hypothetical protein WCI49_07745 [Ferruginibacter sp.]
MLHKQGLILIVLLLVMGVVRAQQPVMLVKGNLLDTSGKQPLVGATISVVFTKDFSLATYVLSDKKGSF